MPHKGWRGAELWPAMQQATLGCCWFVGWWAPALAYFHMLLLSGGHAQGILYGVSVSVLYV